MSDQKDPKGAACPVLLCFGLAPGIVGIGVSVFLALQLVSIPPGSSIRPMWDSAVVGMVSLFALLVGGPICLFATFYCDGRWKVLAIIGIVLTLSPMGVYDTLSNVIADQRGLIFAE